MAIIITDSNEKYMYMSYERTNQYVLRVILLRQTK